VARPIPLPAVVVLIVVVYGCSVYANLLFAVTNPDDYRFFPPFRRHVNGDANQVMTSEDYNIARSLVAGRGFAHPFNGRSGPTAWKPPILPGILAGLFWVCRGNRDAVMMAVIFLQVSVLIGTGLLIVRLAREMAPRLGTGPAVAAFLVGMLYHFHCCFQTTEDCWLVLLALDLLVAGFCWWRPLHGRGRAAGWGLLGGLCALVTPIAGFSWVVLSVLVGIRQRAWSALALALLVAGLVVTPWTARNYLVFGRLIPVRCNLAYELYQSQCRLPDGLLGAQARGHPYDLASREGWEYRRLGEPAYLDHKREQFWQSVSSNPLDFAGRVGTRLLAATLWYVPFDRTRGAEKSWVTWPTRLIHPLPFLALLVLLCLAVRHRLPRGHWVALGSYLCYLLPYIGISYCERYAVPLLGVKVWLVLAAADQLLVLRTRAGRDREARHLAPQPAGPGRPAQVVPA
jgi:hypothetical protein